jgi:hypothetical protein
MNFRLVMQPAMAIFLAVRAGLWDARGSRPAFFWGVLSQRSYRREALRHGWEDIRTVFLLAMILDAIYQVIVHRALYVYQMVIVAIALALIPYLLVRGPVNRIVRTIMTVKKSRERFEGT